MGAWMLFVLACALVAPSRGWPQNGAAEQIVARAPIKAVYPGQTLSMPVQYSMTAPASQLQSQVLSSSTPAAQTTAVTTATPAATAQDRIAKPVIVKVLRSRPQTHTPPPFKSRPSFASKQVNPLTPRFSIPLHLYPSFVKAWEQSQENAINSQFPSHIGSQMAAESNPHVSIQLAPQLSHQLNNQLGPKSNVQFESQLGQFGSNNVGHNGLQNNHFNQHINPQINQIRVPQNAGIHVGLNIGPNVGPNLGPTGNHLGPFEYKAGPNAGRNIGPNVGFSAGHNTGSPGGLHGGSYGGPPGSQHGSPLSGLHGGPQVGPNGGPHAGFQQGLQGGPPGSLYGGPPGSVYGGPPGGHYGGPPGGHHGGPPGGPPNFHASPPGSSVGGPPRGQHGGPPGNLHGSSHVGPQASGHGGPYRTPHTVNSDSYAPTYQHYSTAHQQHSQPPTSHHSATSYRPPNYYGSHSHSHPHYHGPHSHNGHYHSGHHHKGHHHHHSPPNELLELMSPFKKEDGIFPPSTNNPSGLYGSFLMPLMLLGISIPAIGFMYTYFSRRSLNTGFVPNFHVPSQEDLDYYAKLLQEGISCYKNPNKCTK